MSDDLYIKFVEFIRELYDTKGLVTLHAPLFLGNEKEYVLDTIDSTFVSSVGNFVKQFEHKVAEFTSAKYAIATVNGTAALHIALKLAGVERNTEVITQSFTFVATCNAVYYCGAKPIFIDIDRVTLGMSVESLEEFLQQNTEIREDGYCWNKSTKRKISACLPMHTYGFPVELYKIKALCDQYKISLVEDAAESLGSFYDGKHTGTIGKLSAISFNGNKIITTGGGGIILTNDEQLAKKARHITTTAKLQHKWEFNHDEVGYNYRLSNLNAALGVAQMEQLPKYIKNKRKTAKYYQEWGVKHGMEMVKEHYNTRANYWLNTIIMPDKKHRDELLKVTNNNNIMTRPAWTPMHKLSINQGCQYSNLINTEQLSDRIINVPSSVKLTTK